MSRAQFARGVSRMDSHRVAVRHRPTLEDQAGLLRVEVDGVLARYPPALDEVPDYAASFRPNFQAMYVPSLMLWLLCLASQNLTDLLVVDFFLL